MLMGDLTVLWAHPVVLGVLGESNKHVLNMHGLVVITSKMIVPALRPSGPFADLHISLFLI